jgi:tetratricopeptide (TPR) repeat protein
MKEKDEQDNDENFSDEDSKNSIDNDKNKINEEEMNTLLNKNNKTTISTNEVSDTLIINEKIQKIRNMKFDSDGLLKNKKYEEAINSYKDTINTLLEEFKNINTSEILDDLKEEIILPCYQNISLCHMKLKNWLKMKTYSKKVLEIDSENIKATCRLCLANIKLGHLKKADNILEDLERKIGGSPELEELEAIYAQNKLNAEGNNDELLKKMGRKLTGGRINMYSDKKSTFEIEKIKTENKLGCFYKIKRWIRNLKKCCRRRKTKRK